MNELRERIRARVWDEAGVSLVELLIAITISGIIISTLVGAIFFGFRTTNDTQTRVWESGKAGLLASYFVPDVQNAATVQKNVAESAAACGTPRSVAVNLLLTSADGSSVSYYRGSASVAGENTKYLYRKTCVAGSGTALPVIRDLGPTVTFNCAPTTDCVTLPWVSVTGSLTQQDANGKNQYATTIQATKRVT